MGQFSRNLEMIRFNFLLFFHKNGNFSRFPTDFDGFSTAKFVFQ